jgi:hypothetical protein
MIWRCDKGSLKYTSMGIIGTSLITLNAPLYEKASLLGIWRWGVVRKANSYEEVSPHLRLSLKAPLFVFTIRFSLFIPEHLPYNIY